MFDSCEDDEVAMMMPKPSNIVHRSTPNLEYVFPQTSQWYERIVYDRRAGMYYDQETDIYLSLEELPGYGIR